MYIRRGDQALTGMTWPSTSKAPVILYESTAYRRRLTNPNDNVKAHGKTMAPYLSSCDAKKHLSCSNQNWPRSDRWVVCLCGQHGAKQRQHILSIRSKELFEHVQMTGLCGLTVGMPHTVQHGAIVHAQMGHPIDEVMDNFQAVVSRTLRK